MSGTNHISQSSGSDSSSSIEFYKEGNLQPDSMLLYFSLLLLLSTDPVVYMVAFISTKFIVLCLKFFSVTF